MQANNADSSVVVAIINTLLNVLVSTATYAAANMTNALEAANNRKSLEHARVLHHHAMQEVNNRGSMAYVRCSMWMKSAGTKMWRQPPLLSLPQRQRRQQQQPCK